MDYATMLLMAAARKPYKRQVAYLASTQTQWVDTGVIPKLTTCADVDFGIGLIARGYVFSGGGTAYSNEFSGYSIGGGSIQFHYYGRELSFAGAANTTSRYRMICGPSSVSLYQDDALIDTKSVGTAVSAPNDNTIYLFALHRTTTTGGEVRIYRAKFYDGDTLLRDFIPVLDWNDVPCMYDKVSGQLFYNLGTGQFNYA